jgi:hypothetical protein
MAAIPRWAQEGPNPFMGRTQELTDLARLLHDEHRSVMVTGRVWKDGTGPSLHETARLLFKCLDQSTVKLFYLTAYFSALQLRSYSQSRFASGASSNSEGVPASVPTKRGVTTN